MADKKIITIKVRNKIAESCGAELVSDNSDYRIHFDLDSDWDGMPAKTARLLFGKGYYDFPFVGNEVDIDVPIPPVRSVTIGLFAGDIKTSTPAFYKCRPSVKSSQGEPTPPPPEDVYNRIMEMLEDGITIEGGGGIGGGKDGKDGLTPYIKNGTWWIGDGNTGVTAKGTTPMLSVDEDNRWKVSYDEGETWLNLNVKATNVVGLMPIFRIGGDNLWYVSYDEGASFECLEVKATGEDGSNGINGVDGLTPYIKDNFWWIGSTNTSVRAEGVSPIFRIDSDNHWNVSYDKGANWDNLWVKATGADGEDAVSPTFKITETEAGHDVVITDVNGNKFMSVKNGLTPYIKDGNWWVGETDTGVEATATIEMSAIDDDLGIDLPAGRVYNAELHTQLKGKYRLYAEKSTSDGGGVSPLYYVSANSATDKLFSPIGYTNFDEMCKSINVDSTKVLENMGKYCVTRTVDGVTEYYPRLTSIVKRTIDDNVRTNDPVDSNDAVPYEFFYTKLGGKTVCAAKNTSTTYDTIPLRDTKGEIRCLVSDEYTEDENGVKRYRYDGTACVNRNYVNGRLGNAKKAETNSSSTYITIPLRDTKGEMRCNVSDDYTEENGVKKYIYDGTACVNRNYVNSKINAVEAIAKGRSAGYVFDTVDELNTWLDNTDNKAKLVVGDNFYITALEVPDYWWDGAQKQPLETQKVDLSEYAEKKDIPTIPTTLPASDVHDWAKAESKPTYDYTEIENTPTIPTTLPASDVHDWAKAESKPEYDYSEIKNTPSLEGYAKTDDIPALVPIMADADSDEKKLEIAKGKKFSEKLLNTLKGKYRVYVDKSSSGKIATYYPLELNASKLFNPYGYDSLPALVAAEQWGDIPPIKNTHYVEVECLDENGNVIKDENGNVIYSYHPRINTVATRTIEGNIRTGAPRDSTDCINKVYADSTYVKQKDLGSAADIESQIAGLGSAIDAGNIRMSGFENRLAALADIVNKLYENEKFLYELLFSITAYEDASDDVKIWHEDYPNDVAYLHAPDGTTYSVGKYASLGDARKTDIYKKYIK